MVLTKAQAKSLAILDVARSLGMEMKRKSHREYYWAEHDSFKIDTLKNTWHWYSRTGKYGDPINLVQEIKNVSYKEAMHYLDTGEFSEVDTKALEAQSEPFKYTLEKYEHPDFEIARNYLKNERGLSDETIDFFLSQGSMAEATRKKGDYLESVIVFKYKDHTGFLAGASLQVIVENRVQHPERGRLKQIMKNSDGLLGFSVDVGTPNRLLFAESPIDLMSYYELHKDTLQNVRLVAMDGVKEGIISRRFMELYAEMNGKEYKADKTSSKALEAVVRTTDFFKEDNHQNMITLAVDNDAAGHNFITNFLKKEIPVQIDIPPILYRNQDKADWNDYLTRPVTPRTNLSHIYSFDGEEYHYQGYYPEELAAFKQKELATDESQILISKEVLTKKELKSRFDNFPISPEKKVQEVQEASAEYRVSKAQEDTVPEEKKLDNSRLTQAKRKLERLKGEADEAIHAAYSHQSLTNGQPMNDKRGGARFMKKQGQIENRVFSKLDEIKEQEERIERLQEREDRKAAGLNRQGNGLDMSVQNIPRIREEIERAERGESSYRSETIKRYKKELERLEAIQDKVDGLVIQPEAQALIDAGEVKQWAKQPNIYFVKGLRRVALELTEEGRFELSPKYRPNTDEEKEVVNQLLDRQFVKEKGVSDEIPQTMNVWYSTGENAILSNLTPSPLIINNFRFESVEHAYQALKSQGFTEEALSWAESQRSAFEAGRKVQSAHQLGPTNQSNSIRLMESLLVERYRQDAAFRQALSQTKDYQITHSQDNGIWKTEFPRLLMKVRDTESRIPDTSDLSPEEAEWLRENWHNISFSVEPKKQTVIDSDQTVTFEKPSNPIGDTNESLAIEQANHSEIVQTTRVAESIYPGYLVLLRQEDNQERSVYLGKAEKFEAGHYDNSDQSLIYLFSGKGKELRDGYFLLGKGEPRLSREEYLKAYGSEGEKVYQRFDAIVQMLENDYRLRADEKGNRLTNNFRYDIGTEKQDLSEQLVQNLPTPYLELAQKADHDYHTEVSYETFKSSLKNLTQAVQSQIQAGVLSITLSDEAYFYTLVNYTGWSHPMQQLKPEALEKLKEHRLFFESINDTNIERFKEKGTPEQNQMYELLKGIQKELGRSNTSTVFSEEVAISAYNLNRRLNSLTAENWGQSYSDPLGNLGQDTWKILSYPANEIETYNHDYDFQLVSYHLMEYLNGKTGTVEISPETYETILKQLREEAVIIMPEVSEEATISIEKSSKQNKKVVTESQNGGLQMETSAQQYIQSISGASGYYDNISREEAYEIQKALFHPVLKDSTDAIEYLMSWSVDSQELRRLIEYFKDESELPITLTQAQYGLTDIRETIKQELSQSVNQEESLKSQAKNVLKDIELVELNDKGEYVDTIALLKPASYQEKSRIVDYVRENHPDKYIRVDSADIDELNFYIRDGKASSNELNNSNQKAPEKNQEQNKKVETNLGDFPEESQVAAPLPEANESQPLNDLSPSQTRSQPLLHFSINEERKSIHKDNYHPVSDKDLRKLNRYTPHLQNAAAWYLENIADSQVTYFYQEGANTNSVTISYNKESFMHLTGIFPYKEGQTAEQTLSDFAAGNGQFDNILIANRGAAFDKLKVLPELPVIVDSESFYFGDLSDVEKFHTLNLDKAIRSSDQDVLLAFRTVDGTTFPASLMRLRQGLNLQLDQSNQEKIILGIYRERNRKIEQLSINEDYIKDGGRELQSIMENGLFEEDISKEEPPFPNRSDYDSYLDYLDAVIEYKQEEGRRNGIFVDPNESLVDAARRLGVKLKDDLVEQEEVSKIDSGQTIQETVDFKEELPMAEPFTDAQKEHIREFFKTRISDVKKDYIYLNSGREDTAYYLDGYLFAHQYAELFPLSPDQQVDALMSRLVSEDGQKFDYVEEGFTIDRIDQDFLKDKFGYNPDTPIEEYRQSEKNIDRIQAKEEEAFLQSIDRENFVKVLDLVKENDVWTVFQLKEELGLEVDTSQLYDFIDRYLDPNHDLTYGFSNDLFSNLKTDVLLKKAEEKGLYSDQNQIRDKALHSLAKESKQEITEYKLEPHWESANEITANSFEELKMKFLEQMDRHIKLEKEFTASNLEFQKDRHSIAMGVWPDKQILKYMRDDSFDFKVNGFRIESSWNDNPYDLLDSISEDGKIFDEMTYHEIQKEMKEYQQVQNEEIHQHNRKDEIDRDLDGLPDRVEEASTTLLDSPDSDGDGISDYDELTQGTDPNNFNSNIYRTAEKELNDVEKQTEMIEVQEEVEDKKTKSKNNFAKVNSSNKQKETPEEVEEVSSKMISELIVAGDIAGLNQHLKEGVKQYLNSEHYKHYLDKMSQLNNYSSRNIQLILAQNPNAKYVTSLNKWNKEFGRYINKGEKALKIIAPNIHLKKDSEGNPMLDKEGKPVTYMTFQVNSVFDVSQTKGKELPKALQPVKENLSDLDYANLYRSLKTIADNNHVQVRFEQLDNGRRGLYNPKNNEIVIHKDMGKAQIIKTFLHETAHSELHHSHHPQKENLTYSNAELQAESVAYVVASYYGMDTAEHSFGYLAKWTDDKKALSDLEAQLDIVQQEAKSLIQRMDKELEKLKVIQVKQDKNRFADKLSHYQSKTEKSIQERQTKEEKDSKKLKGISK